MVTDQPEAEGAVGYTAPSAADSEGYIPEWQSSQGDDDTQDEMSEVRRRRLQKFSSQTSRESQEKNDH